MKKCFTYESSPQVSKPVHLLRKAFFRDEEKASGKRVRIFLRNIRRIYSFPLRRCPSTSNQNGVLHWNDDTKHVVKVGGRVLLTLAASLRASVSRSASTLSSSLCFEACTRARIVMLVLVHHSFHRWRWSLFLAKCSPFSFFVLPRVLKAHDNLNLFSAPSLRHRTFVKLLKSLK